MKIWIAPTLCVLIFLFANADARNRVALPAVADEEKVTLLVHEISVLQEAPFYIHIREVNPSSSDPPPPNFICSTCLDISRKIEGILDDPELSEKADTLSAQICHFMPPDLESKCADILKTHINQTISYLQSIFHEEDICYSAGICAENARPPLFAFRGLSKAQALRVPDFSLHGTSLKLSDNKACTTCHNATDAFLKALENPETKIKILKALLEACKEIESHVPQCKKMVFEYGPIVIARIEKYLKTNDLCSLLQFCHGDAAKLMEV